MKSVKLFLLGGVFSLVLGGMTAEAAKISLPLSVKASIVSGSVKEEPVTIEATVKVLEDADSLRVICRLPPGVSLSDGEALWEGGAMKKGVGKTFRYQLENSTGGYIPVTIVGEWKKGTMTASDHVDLEINSSLKSRSKARQWPVKKLPGGGSVVEMRGQ